jgi:hypothetical protein
MKIKWVNFKWILLCCFFSNTIEISFAQNDLSPYRVIWDAPSINSSGSMPLGNGDIGSNIWVSPDGNLHLLLSKTDAMSEIGRLLKIGKLEIAMQPNILAGNEFKQELILEKGMIRITGKNGQQEIMIDLWVNANEPLIHVSGISNTPVKVQVKQLPWRTIARPLTGSERHSGYGVAFRDEKPFFTETDTLLDSKIGLAWCHNNTSSIWYMTLENQNITDFASLSSDPLLHQQFGALVGGDGFLPSNTLTLDQKKPAKTFDLNILINKSKNDHATQWLQGTEKIYRNTLLVNRKKRLRDHQQWWKNFWNRHYLIIESETEKEKEKTKQITQAYLLQRYMNACAGRGGLPIKFNGSIFTVNLNENMGSGKKGFDADYREWGGNYWFQNTRLIYWTMYQSGDFELMKPFFDMYINALPLAKFRTKKYFQHDGAYFPETLTPWGSYLIDNYGWNRVGKKDGVADNMFIRYYWQGGLELCTMMTTYFQYTLDSIYFKQKMLPFIREIISFYDQHYMRDPSGKILIEPAQSLETFQDGMLNPTPEIAGLMQNLSQLIRLRSLIADDGFINTCEELMTALPPLPIGDTVGKWVILPGSRLGVRSNIENPELYTIFPYRLFGIGMQDLELARHTFDYRHFKQTGGWHQDAIQAALLGKTEEATSMVTKNFLTKNAGSRFPVFWGPNYDWVPDQDHGSVAATALQFMLLQPQEDTLHLIPSWPKTWNVKFKFNVPGNQVLEGSYDRINGIQIKDKPIGFYIATHVKD